MAVTIDGTNGITSPDFEPSSSTTPTNGLFLPAANAVGFATNSSERVRIDSSGNVGIGTSSPATKLHVSGTGSTPSLFERTGSNGVYLQLKDASGSSVYLGASNGVFAIQTPGSSYSDKLVIDSSGNLGLGVTPSGWYSASKAMQLGATGTIEGRSGTEVFQLGSNWYINSGGSYAYTTSAASTRYSQTSGGHYWYNAPSGTAGNAISFTQAMTLDASGNLGIGTTSPPSGSRLAISGGALNFTDTSSRDILWGTSSYVYITGNQGTGVLAMGTASTERARIDSSGNFGIGTSSPGYKLEVNGSAYISGPTLYVGNTGTYISYRSANNDVIWQGSSGLFWRTDIANSTHSWFTGNVERARIDSSGTLFVGQTTNPATSTVVLKVPTGTGNGVNAQITSNTGTSYPWSNYNASGTYVGGISCTSSATAFPTSSDERLKENVHDAANTLSTLLLVKIRSFDWKIDKTHQDYGVIAQEIKEHIPEAVLVSPGEGDYLSVDYTKIIPRLVKAIQELTARLEALENK